MPRSIIDYRSGLFQPKLDFDYGGKPVCVNFSGGRSSGAMLRLLLDYHGGTLPKNWHVVFTNTGKEDPKTLDFVKRCEDEWRVGIVWLEFTNFVNDKLVTFQEVNYETASRTGTPFEAMLANKNYFPRRMQRLCTIYMKICVVAEYLTSIGYETSSASNGVRCLGYRFDEKHRLHNAHMTCGKNKYGDSWFPEAPLIHAGIDKNAIFSFWAQMPFDLEVAEHNGNCDLCFLKKQSKLIKAIQENPSRADWWIKQEEQWGKQFAPMPYRQLKQLAMTDSIEPSEDDFQDLECNCTD